MVFERTRIQSLHAHIFGYIRNMLGFFLKNHILSNFGMAVYQGVGGGRELEVTVCKNKLVVALHAVEVSQKGVPLIYSHISCSSNLGNHNHHVEVSQKRGPFLGASTIRIMVYWYPFWGALLMETSIALDATRMSVAIVPCSATSRLVVEQKPQHPSLPPAAFTPASEARAS